MSYRFMRMMVFFDLPTETAEDRRNYRKFRRMLIQNGFVMLQESVYCKLVLNSSIEAAILRTIRQNKPPSGLVQVLTVTEKQFSRMELISGSMKQEVLDSDEKVVFL